MQVERRALFNLLRQNWLLDPTIAVEPWQVADYRNLSYNELYGNLEQLGVHLDNETFVSLAQAHDNPEDFTNELLEAADIDEKTEEHLYLLLFELWRRFVPEKPCISIFCDELDHQIYNYDQGKYNLEEVEDSIANLQVILDENADEGGEVHEVFECIKENCANDLTAFLYDYIADLIDSKNYTYASEMLEGFLPYLQGDPWFELLRVRMLFLSDQKTALAILDQIIANSQENPNLELNLEILSFVVQEGDKQTFVDLVARSIPLLESEQDFQDLMSICVDYYSCSDLDEKEKAVANLLSKREGIPLEKSIKQDEKTIKIFLEIIKS